MSVKISELPVLDSLADNDVLAGVDTSANTTSKVTLGSLKQYIDTNTTYTAGTNINITNNVVSAPNVYNKTETDNLLSAKESVSNKVTSISSSSTNAQYPSAKSVYSHVSTTKTQIEETLGDVINETKGELDGDIEQLNNEVEELQSEVDSLSMIYNAFPTESDEDESMTLDGTAEVKFKKFDLKGNTSQVTTTGKNLLDTQYFERGAIATDGSETTTVTNAKGSNYIPVLPNTSYTISASRQLYDLRLNEYASDKTHIKRNTKINTTSLTITTSSTTYFVRWSFNYDNSTATTQEIIDNLKLQLEENSSATSYEPFTNGTVSPNPDYPQAVNVVSGDNTIQITGKNMVDISALQTQTINGITVTNNGNGSITLGGTSTSETNLDFPIPSFSIKNGVTYTFSKETVTNAGRYALLFRGLNNTNLSGLNTNLDSAQHYKNLNPTSDYTIAYMRIYIPNNKTIETHTIYPMLEVGSDKTNFANFQGIHAYNIDLPVENKLAYPYIETTKSLYGIDYTVYSDGTIKVNGTATNNSTFAIANQTSTGLRKLLLNNGCYLSGCPSGGSSTTYTLQLYGYNSSGTGTLRDVGDGVDLSYFVNENSNFNIAIFIGTGTTINNLVFKPMLEIGSKANSYTPYGTTPIELCKIGNYQDGFGKSDGSQLFDKDNANILNASISNNVINPSTNAKTLYIRCKPNTIYTISRLAGQRFQVAYCENTPNIGTTVSGLITNPTGSIITITTNARANYLAIYYFLNNTDTLTEQQIRDSIMINEGGSALPWQPYGVGKWYLHKEIGVKVYNGSESWTLRTNDGTNYCYANADLSDYLHKDTIVGLSNYFSKVKVSSGYANALSQGIGLYFYVLSGSSDTNFYLVTNTSTTANNLKTWLNSNNVEVYYPLATPTGIEITYQPLIDQLNLLEQAMSKENQTNISQANNDKPFIIKAEAILSLKNVLDRVTLLES